VKKYLLVSIAIVSVLGIALIGCSDTTTTTTVQSSTPEQTTTPETQTIELKHSAFCVPTMAIGQVLQQYADMVYSKSGGRLKITIYWGESLSKMIDNSKAVQSGIAEMAEYDVASSPGLQELSRVTQLPFLGHTSYEEANWVFEQLYDEFPEIRAEWEGLKVLGMRHYPGYQFHFTDKAVHVPEDMKGMKLISNPNYVEFLSEVGVAPVEIGYGDWYLSLERGMADGMPMHFVAVYAMKLLDLLKYHTMFGEFGCHTSGDVFLINMDVWNSLPSDLQQILEEAVQWRMQEVTKSDSEQLAEGLAYAEAQGHHFIYLTPEEMKLWEDAAKASEHEKWIKDNAAKGPTQAIYDEAIRLINSYNK
jgi:TRAP-type C4-dicarboxylate transport system substrate-binding protein